MNWHQFHYTMTNDEFGNNSLANNYYILFGLMFAYVVFWILVFALLLYFYGGRF